MTPYANAQPPLQMAPDQVRTWWDRIDLARQRRKQEADDWQKLYQEYLPPKAEANSRVNSNIHFRDVHLKIAETWSQLPEFHLTPLEPLEGLLDPQTQQPIQAEDVVAVKRALLNKLLGPDHANLDQQITDGLFNTYATSGYAAYKICYESDIQEVPTQAPGPPQPMPGAVLNLQPVPGPMQTVMAKVPVHERWRFYHFSEAKHLLPHDWHSTDYDEAPWQGMEFVMLADACRRKYQLPPDFGANATRDDLIIESGRGREPGEGTNTLIKGVEIWARATFCDPTVVNSQLFYVIVLIEGLTDRPAEYRRSPYQDVGPTDRFPNNPPGRLTPDSMIGNPIHPIALRVAGDTAYPPSDSAFTDPLVRQENVWMGQDLKARDSNIPRFFHSDVIGTQVDKLKNADTGQGVAVPHEHMMVGVDKLIAPVPHLENAQSDTAGYQRLRRAREETLGLGSNQAGAVNDTVKSATEIATVQQNVSVRLKGEQNVLLRRVLQGVRKFDALVQRYMDTPGYVEILGQNGARRLQMYDQHLLSGRYAYDAKIDSQLSNDPNRRIKNATDFINFMAKSPWMDQGELARLAALEFGYDPGRLVKEPQPPPEPPPEKPRISFAFNGADLAIPEVRQILGLNGVQLGPPSLEAIMAHQTAQAKAQPHGGAADKADVLSKHHSDETGAMPGRTPEGAPPQNATGMIQ